MSECKHIKTFYYVENPQVLQPLNRYPNGTISPLVIMHDLFHHFPNDKGLVEDELRAFGALIYISSGTYLNLELKKYDYMFLVEQIISLMSYKELVCFKQCQRNATIKNPQDYAIINNIKEALLAKPESYWIRYGYEPVPTYHDLLNIMRWVVKGYNQAKRRYIGINQEDLSNNYYDMLFSLQKIKVYDGYVFVDANIEAAQISVTDLGILTFADWDSDIKKYRIDFDLYPEYFLTTNPNRFNAFLSRLES